MRQWEKIWKSSFKKFKKIKIFSKYFIHRYKISYLNTNQVISPHSKKLTSKGNIEFLMFSGIVGLTLLYIHKNKNKYNETVLLAAAGITSHIIVDFLTYMCDKINTKAKIEYFYKKKNIPANISKNYIDINYYFNKKFIHFKPVSTPKKRKDINFKKSISNFLSKFQLRGIQSAMVFLVFNSAIFYGSYKNIKFYLKEKLHLEGFINFSLSAAIAQFIAMLVAFPLENMKTRMQASNFNYETISKYYYNIINTRKQRNKSLKDLIKIEYSGFFSHLLLYVVYESVTFGIYESLIKYLSKEKNEDCSYPYKDESNKQEHFHKEKNFGHILLASGLSGIVSAILTNPIDVYQINKQINPSFNIRKLDMKNSFAGLKERVVLITLVNLCTFLCLETIGPGLFNVQLE
jgi:hypothetical protein